MNSIGIRVTPKKIYYTIINNENEYTNEVLIIPRALDNDTPRQLSFIRTTLHSIICESDVGFAGIRTAEGNAQTVDRFRISLEGVIQELFSDSTIINYFTGTKTSIQHRLNISSTDVTECINGTLNIYDIESWDSIAKNHRESFLSAMSAQPLSGGDLDC